MWRLSPTRHNATKSLPVQNRCRAAPNRARFGRGIDGARSKIANYSAIRGYCLQTHIAASRRIAALLFATACFCGRAQELSRIGGH
jgi:hypothetical protein